MEELIKYHQNKLEWHTKELDVFLNLPEWTNEGYYKGLFDKNIAKHTKAIEFHEQAVKTLKECVE